MSLSSVDLPQPLGPTTVTNSPGGMFKSMLWSALIAPSAGRAKKLGDVFNLDDRLVFSRFNCGFRHAIGLKTQVNFCLYRNRPACSEPS